MAADRGLPPVLDSSGGRHGRVDKESIMKRHLRIALIACFVALYSAAALAVPAYVLNPPPYGTLRTYYDHPTGIVKGQYVSCGEFSSAWGVSNGYSYFDRSIDCP